MIDIDTSTDFGARVTRHLVEDTIIWLTTVDPDLTPQPSPVWFLWDGRTVLIYSQPKTPKLRNIEQRPHVSLSFNCTPSGGDVVILTGDASIDAGAPPANAIPAFVEKYAEGLAGIAMSADEFATSYSIAIRVTPADLRGF